MLAGVVLLEVCDANAACTAELEAVVHQYPQAALLETSCLGFCELCAQHLCVLADGELLTASDWPRLLGQVEEVLQRCR